MPNSVRSQVAQLHFKATHLARQSFETTADHEQIAAHTLQLVPRLKAAGRLDLTESDDEMASQSAALAKKRPPDNKIQP